MVADLSTSTNRVYLHTWWEQALTRLQVQLKVSVIMENGISMWLASWLWATPPVQGWEHQGPVSAGDIGMFEVMALQCLKVMQDSMERMVTYTERKRKEDLNAKRLWRWLADLEWMHSHWEPGNIVTIASSVVCPTTQGMSSSLLFVLWPPLAGPWPLCWCYAS